MKNLSRQRVIIYSLLLVLMIIGNIYYFRKNFFSQEQELVAPTTSNLPAEDLSAVRPVVSSSPGKQPAVLEQQLFYELKKIGDWPVTPSKIGRVNPFLPYFD